MFQGITDATMSHNEAWHFLRLGRMIERADKTSRILDVKYFILLPSSTQPKVQITPEAYLAAGRWDLDLFRKHGIRQFNGDDFRDLPAFAFPDLP